MHRCFVAGTSTLSAAILATVLGFGGALTIQATPAAAYDDDVDVVCFDYQGSGGSETECQTIEQLTAECALTDPEFTTDVCGGLLENRKPFGLTTSSGDKENEKKKKKHRRDRDNDSGKGRDHNDGGGNNGGGGNSGGGNGGGGNGGGSGPNG